MPFAWTLLALVLCVVFVAALVRATWGFGDAMIGVPILSLLIGLPLTTPTLALLSVVLAILLLRERPQLVELGVVARLLLGALAGAPLGLYVLVELPVDWAHRVLGAVLIGFAIWGLSKRSERSVRGWWLDLLFGVVVGASNVAFDISGPILLIHAALRGWNEDELRMNLQAVFLPLGLLTATTHALGGLWTREVLILAACALPAVLLANLLGPKLRAKLAGERGRKLLYGLILALGVLQFVL